MLLVYEALSYYLEIAVLQQHHAQRASEHSQHLLRSVHPLSTVAAEFEHHAYVTTPHDSVCVCVCVCVCVYWSVCMRECVFDAAFEHYIYDTTPQDSTSPEHACAP